MKVVLFCGGRGTRIREYSESVPKPLIPLGFNRSCDTSCNITPVSGTKTSSSASATRRMS